MHETEVKDSYTGSKDYVEEIAKDLLEAWRTGSYSYVFSELGQYHFSAALAFYLVLPYEQDRERFLEKLWNRSRSLWLEHDEDLLDNEN